MSELRARNDAAVPACPHFGACGGCQLQDIGYSAQLERKVQRLRDLLGSLKLPEVQVHESPAYEYRNRIRLTLREVDGVLRAGYLGDSQEEDGQQRDLKFVPITQCPIAAPLLWRAAEVFVGLAKGGSWLRPSPFVPDQLELFTTADESWLQLTLFLRTPHKSIPAKLGTDFSALCEVLHTQIPQLAGAGIALLPAAGRSRRVEQPQPGPTWGPPGLNYSVVLPRVESRREDSGSLTYWVPRGAFFQVNRFLLPELVRLVARVAASCASDALAWDLYAGVGLFSRILAENFRQVTAVEIAEPATTALAQTKLSNLRAVKATTLDFLRGAAVQRDRPSLMVVDPPRTGMGAEVCELLARLAAPRLVYVSCSPEALARDLAMLTASGYSVDESHLFDLFPQTEHMETVVILHRNSRSGLVQD